MVHDFVKRRATRWFAALLLAVGWSGQTAWSQVPGLGQNGSAAASQTTQARSVHYTKRRTFHLPVKFDPRSRMRIREVHLYRKTALTDWARLETGTSATNKFTYTAMKDGAYWFCVTTVDDQGRTTPPTIDKSLKIVVDATPPKIEASHWTSPQGQPCVRCMVRDDNPNPATLQVSFVDRANNLQPMEPHLQHPGVFLAPNPTVWTGKLHVRCSDNAKNEVSEFLNIGLPTPKTPTPVPIPTHVVKKRIVEPVRQPEPVQEPTIPLPPLPNKQSVIPVAAKKPIPAPNIAPEIQPPESKQAPVSLPQSTEQRDANLINTTKAEVEYRVDKVGPSGVGVVDIYMSSNDGRTWQFLHKDTDMRTPAQIQLPGEGVFGICVVITNGNGFGGTAPRSGDQPDFRIEVDTTRPQVRLADINPYAKDGKLDIRWTASDRNLSATPVTLYYRTSPTDQWQVIARNVHNEGAYSWAFPRDKGGRFYVRLEASDRAGNVARAETSNPVVLDMTEPQAQVVGVRPVSGEPAPFQAPSIPQQ